MSCLSHKCTVSERLSLSVFPGHWTDDDLHSVSGRLHQPAVWQPVRTGCSQISVLSFLTDVPAALPAADWSQTSLHPQPALLPGAHTDQVIGWITSRRCQLIGTSWHTHLSCPIKESLAVFMISAHAFTPAVIMQQLLLESSAPTCCVIDLFLMPGA